MHVNKAHENPNQFSFSSMTLEISVITSPMAQYSKRSSGLNPRDLKQKSKFQDSSLT